MTLGFMQQWPKEMAMTDSKTYFIEKINLALWKEKTLKRIDYIEYLEDYRTKFGDNWDWKPHLKPKLHTIRADEHDRWEAGIDIHFVVNSRSKSRFQFAPVVPVVSVQTIEIEYFGSWLTIRIDNRMLKPHEIAQLAFNDGFESIEHFKSYFKTNLKGKLIHWTNLKY